MLNINTLEKCEASTLALNEIGECICHFDQDVAFEPYNENPHLGSFIIIDRQTNNTIGMGLIKQNVGQESWAERHVMERNKYWSSGQVSHLDRSYKNQHQPMLIVLTGHVTQRRLF